jgi:murein DD-endopeptidase MepM/ murein hydrolase activator NlpD
MRFHPILRYTKLHTGTDFAGGGGAVRAADDGRVIMTAVSGAYGNLTVVDHGVVDGERVTTAYAHQARVLVAEGDVVRKGETIGVIGSTGYSTGPHLHFEVREDGAVVDPGRYL